MSQIKASPEIMEITDKKEQMKYIQLFLQSVVDVVNGRIEFKDNVKISSQSVVFSAADTDTTVAHGLGRAPRGYLVVGLSAAMIIYDGSKAKTATNITLKSNAAGTAQIVFL